MSVVRVHIDRLVIEGREGIDGRAVGAATERELARALAGAPWASARRARVDGGSVAPADGTPQALGRAVGLAVARRLAP